MSRVLRGDREAYRELVLVYEPVIRRLALKYLRREEDAEDAVQEIFIKAYRSLGRFELNRRFLPWLYSVALNHLKTVYRRTRRIGDREVAEERAGDPSFASDRPADDPEHAALRRAAEEELRAAVDRLPPSLRDAVLLYYLQEASVDDVGEALGLGRENVKSKLHRARKRLREILESTATDRD